MKIGSQVLTAYITSVHALTLLLISWSPPELTSS